MRTNFLLILFLLLLSGCSKPSTSPPPQAAPTEADGRLVELTAEAQSHVGIRVSPVERKRLVEFLHVTGTVQPADSSVAEVRPLARGRLQEVSVKVGDRVRRGHALARFDNIEAGELMSQRQSAQAELARLRIQLANTTRQVERARALIGIGAISRRELELNEAEQDALIQSVSAQNGVIGGLEVRLRRLGAEGSGSQSAVTVIESPLNGVVIRVEAAPGAVVDSDRSLFAIADLSEVWVQAEVFERDLGRIRTGQSATVSVDTFPGEQFPARVTYISDILDSRTRTAKVRCEISNRDMRLKLDMFATVALPTTFERHSIAVPSSALQQIAGKQVLFVRKTATRFEVRDVKAGKSVGSLVEISEGLTEGELVVTQGAFHLKSIALGKELSGEEK